LHALAGLSGRLKMLLQGAKDDFDHLGAQPTTICLEGSKQTEEEQVFRKRETVGALHRKLWKPFQFKWADEAASWYTGIINELHFILLAIMLDLKSDLHAACLFYPVLSLLW